MANVTAEKKARIRWSLFASALVGDSNDDEARGVRVNRGQPSQFLVSLSTFARLATHGLIPPPQTDSINRQGFLWLEPSPSRCCGYF